MFYRDDRWWYPVEDDVSESKTGKRVQIYLDNRHVAWWAKLPRYDRSRIVAEALDLYRKQRDSELNGALDGAPTPTPPDDTAS